MLKFLDAEIYSDGTSYRLEIEKDVEEVVGKGKERTKTGNIVKRKYVAGYPSTIENCINLYIRTKGMEFINSQEHITLNEFIEKFTTLKNEILKECKGF